MPLSETTTLGLKVGAAAFGIVALGSAISGRSMGTSLALGVAAGAVGLVGTQALRGPVAVALNNRASKFDIEHGYGALTPPALHLLAKVNSDELFAPQTFNGWVIGDVPANEYEVAQR